MTYTGTVIDDNWKLRVRHSVVGVRSRWLRFKLGLFASPLVLSTSWFFLLVCFNTASVKDFRYLIPFSTKSAETWTTGHSSKHRYEQKYRTFSYRKVLLWCLTLPTKQTLTNLARSNPYLREERRKGLSLVRLPFLSHIPSLIFEDLPSCRSMGTGR